MVVLSNGDLLLAMDDSMHSRTPLVLAISRDGGIAWEKVGSVFGFPKRLHCTSRTLYSVRRYMLGGGWQNAGQYLNLANRAIVDWFFWLHACELLDPPRVF